MLSWLQGIGWGLVAEVTMQGVVSWRREPGWIIEEGEMHLLGEAGVEP
jgi:hypothetical protein